MPVSFLAVPFPLPLGQNVRVLACHSCGLVALEKPEGIRSHPNNNRPDNDALLTVPYDPEEECYLWSDGGREIRFWLLNRLDAPTSGVLLGASQAAIADKVKGLFREKKVKKVYRALVKGNARHERGIWRDRFSVNRQGGLVRAGCGGAVEAAVGVKCLQATHGTIPVSLLELTPQTGRTHQLRVQCAEHGFPILGDATYGDFRLNRDLAKRTGIKRLFLHCCHISLDLEAVGVRTNASENRFTADSPLPEVFTQVQQEKLFHG